MTNEQQRKDLYESICIAREQRARAARVENIIGNVLMSVLGACVVYAIAAWFTR